MNLISERIREAYPANESCLSPWNVRSAAKMCTCRSEMCFLISHHHLGPHLLQKNVTPFRMGIVRKRAHCYWASLDEGKNLDGRISTRQIRKLSEPSSIPCLGVKVRSHAPSQKPHSDQYKMHLKVDKDVGHERP